jgi:hypothetical protein
MTLSPAPSQPRFTIKVLGLRSAVLLTCSMAASTVCHLQGVLGIERMPTAGPSLVRPEQPEDQPSMRVSSQIGVAQSAGS